jgi:hypothetical protein
MHTLEDAMAQNVIVYADELAAEARTIGGDYKAVSAHVQTRATAEHPMYLGMVLGVNYLEKSDRYVVKFGTSSAKVTAEVAQFLLTEVFSAQRSARPSVYAHMTEGTIDAVLLLFVSRS